MVEKRHVLGQPEGELLVQLLNRRFDVRDRRARLIQRQLERLFLGISLIAGLGSSNPRGDWQQDVKARINRLNRFLKTCAEYPQVFVGRHIGKTFLQLEFVPHNATVERRNAVSAICALVRYGVLDRVRQCQRVTNAQGGTCGTWFFAKKSDGRYHSRECQTMATEERKQHKREYARRRYWRKKELESFKGK